MSGRWGRLRTAGLALVTLVAAGIALARSAGAAPPARIVSLNVCSDQILIDLVPRSRIAAVTHLATDPLTAAHPERAQGLPFVRGTAEEVLARDPDLVVAGEWSTPATIDVLRRLGRRVETVPQPQTFDGVRALIVRLGALVEEPAAAARLIAAMDERIAAARARLVPDGSRRTALVYQVNNYASATDSLIGEALTLAGFVSAEPARGGRLAGRVGVETIVSNPPDLLVLASGPTTYRTAVADNLRHPALATLARTTPAIVVPWPLWLCGTHHAAEAVERLAAMRR